MILKTDSGKVFFKPNWDEDSYVRIQRKPSVVPELWDTNIAVVGSTSPGTEQNLLKYLHQFEDLKRFSSFEVLQAKLSTILAISAQIQIDIIQKHTNKEISEECLLIASSLRVFTLATYYPLFLSGVDEGYEKLAAIVGTLPRVTVEAMEILNSG